MTSMNVVQVKRVNVEVNLRANKVQAKEEVSLFNKATRDKIDVDKKLTFLIRQVDSSSPNPMTSLIWLLKTQRSSKMSTTLMY